MYNPSKIYLLAYHFRQAIESLPKESLPPTFSSFPRGACGDTSLLLGTYFVENGYADFEYITGERETQNSGKWSSHAWLEAGNLVVDITADQFKDAPSKIIVAAPSPWHQGFSVERRQPADFRFWSGGGTYHLHALYSHLKAHL